MTNTVVYPFAVIMNKAKWNALPDDVKKVMDDLAREQAKWTGTYMDGHVNDAIAWSKETHGVELITLDADGVKTWNAPLVPITEKWITKAEEKGFPGKAIVDDISALIAR
jgi:TRAP-type C4-dicarboxylate transport system substrate-binding protein